MNEKLTNRVPVLMSGSEIKAIDDWRFAHRIGSRGEAIRRLAARGLQPASADAVGVELTKTPMPPDPQVWDKEAPNATEALNVRISARVKRQIECLANQPGDQRTTLRQIVEDALRQYVRPRGFPG